MTASGQIRSILTRRVNDGFGSNPAKLPALQLGPDNNPLSEPKSRRPRRLIAAGFRSASRVGSVRGSPTVFQRRRGNPPINWIHALNCFGELGFRLGSRSAPIGTLLMRQIRAFEQPARAIFPWDHEAVLFHTQLTATGWESASDHRSVAVSPGCTGAAKYVLSGNS